LKALVKTGFLILFMSASLFVQAQSYSVSNAHSHNDYEQRIPFWMAYHAGFGSIEADIFLVDSVLYVAHDREELGRKMRLDTAYLIPITECLQKNNGHPYKDRSKKLQLLIDVKTEATSTLNALIILLNKYPSLIYCKSLSWVITGNRPEESLFTVYPDFVLFDGVLSKNYSRLALSKIAMMSDDFKNYSSWNGENILPLKDDSILHAAVYKSHHLHKPVRFWNAPDQSYAWLSFMMLEVDYINTDHIDSLAAFLNK
jgi:alkaline phosphatase